MKRFRLTPADLFRTAGLGITGRPQRTALAALGIALGIAALVALTGTAASNQAALLAEFDRMGANIAVVSPGIGADGAPVPLPPDTPERLARQDHVERVGTFEAAPTGLNVYRNHRVPSHITNGLSVTVARPDALAAIDGTLAAGRWFYDATRAQPVAVLGANAAARLGVSVGDRLWIADPSGGRSGWYGVLGILEPSLLAGGVTDSAAILGDKWVRSAFADDDSVGQITQVYVQANPGQLDALLDLLRPAARPDGPHLVTVSALLNLAAARDTADDALATLGLILGGISLLVGGVGIANTMVVTVMERRGEIGLRRALGARPGQVAGQFVTEAIILAAFGGLIGAALGVLAAFSIARVGGQPVVIPVIAVVAGPVLSVVVGALAGLQPAVKAARVAPVVALRAV